MDFSSKKWINADRVRNIIFDFGGIIINIDYRLTAQAFEQLGVIDFEPMFSQAKQSSLFDRLEVGEISPAVFRGELRSLANLDVSDAVLDRAWNAMLLDYPGHRLEFLSAIKSRYRTFLLSNTNSIHMECYYASLYREHKLQNLNGLFERLYFSHEVGMRKPGEAIYRRVLEENGLVAEETLFIDDTAMNLEAPHKLGMQVYHLTGGEDVVDFAEAAGLISGYRSL